MKPNDQLTSAELDVLESERERAMKALISSEIQPLAGYQKAADLCRRTGVLFYGINPDSYTDKMAYDKYVKAIKGNDQDGLRLLIAAGVDMNVTGDTGRTPLGVAIRDYRWPVIDDLVEAGATQVFKENGDQGILDETLIEVIMLGDRRLIDATLAKGASPNAMHAPTGRNALMHVVGSAQSGGLAGDDLVDVAKQLVAQGADLETKDLTGQTVVELAESEPKAAIVADWLRQCEAEKTLDSIEVKPKKADRKPSGL